MDFDGTDHFKRNFPTTSIPHVLLLREQQCLSFLANQRYISANPSFIQRLELQRRLQGHGGCVNCCTFTPSGSHLISGSDDMQIKLFDWQQGSEVFSWNSGHDANVFQAKVLANNLNQSPGFPSSPIANLTVVSSGADGQVRIHHIFEGRVVHRCVCIHAGSAHKVALVPDNPWTFLSCGEDGYVNHFDLREAKPHSSLMRVPQSVMKGFGGTLELYSVACNPVKTTEFCIGGQDEGVRVFDLRKSSATATAGAGTRGPKAAPCALPLAFISPQRLSNLKDMVDLSVTSAVYSCRGEILASYNDENVYLFSAEVASGVEPRRWNQYGGGGADKDDGVEFGSSSPLLPGKSTRSKGGRKNNSSSPRGGRRPRGRGGRAAQTQAARHREHDYRMWQERERIQQEINIGRRRAQGTITRRVTRAEELDNRVQMRYFKYKITHNNQTKVSAERATASPLPYTLGSQNQNEIQKNPLDIPDSFLAKLHADRDGDHIMEDGNLDIISSISISLNSSSSSDGSGTSSSISNDIESGGDGDTTTSSSSDGDCEDNNDSDDSDREEFDNSYANDMRALFSWVQRDLHARENSGNSNEESEEESDDESEDDLSSDEEEDYEEIDEKSDDDDYDLASRWPLPGFFYWSRNNIKMRSSSGALTNNLERYTNEVQGGVLQMYQGHRNQETIKGVSFFGLNDEWVMSGSDCGHIYFWSTKIGEAVASYKGDSHVVNCLERHPHDIFTLATSGIDSDVKIWGCSAVERLDGLSARDLKRMEHNKIKRNRNYMGWGLPGRGYESSESDSEED